MFKISSVVEYWGPAGEGRVKEDTFYYDGKKEDVLNLVEKFGTEEFKDKDFDCERYLVYEEVPINVLHSFPEKYRR